MKLRKLLSSANLLSISIYVILFLMFFSFALYNLADIDFNSEMSHIILCPFKYITGFECPGCGMTRAFIAISQLDFYSAFKFNFISYPLLFSMVIYLTPFKKRAYELFIKYKLEYFSLIVIFVFWFYRFISVL